MRKVFLLIVFVLCASMISCTNRKDNQKDIINDSNKYDSSSKTDYNDNNPEIIPLQRKQLNEYGVDFNGDLISIITREAYRIDPFSDEYTFSDKLQRQKEIRMIENAYNCKLQIINSKYLRKYYVEHFEYTYELSTINNNYLTKGIEAAEEEYNRWMDIPWFLEEYNDPAMFEEKGIFDDLVYSNPTFYYSPIFEELHDYLESMGGFELFGMDAESMEHLSKNQYFNDADKLLYSNVMFFNENSQFKISGEDMLYQIPADEVPLINLASTYFYKTSVDQYTQVQRRIAEKFRSENDVDLIKSINLNDIRSLSNYNKTVIPNYGSLMNPTSITIPNYTMALANYNGLTAKTINDISDEFINLLIDNYFEYGMGYSVTKRDDQFGSYVQFFSNYVTEAKYILHQEEKSEYEETENNISVCSPYIIDKKDESVIPSTYYSYKIIAPFLRVNTYKLSDMVDLMTDLSMAFVHDPKVEYEKLAYANRNNQKTLNYIEKIKDMNYSFDYTQFLTIAGLREFNVIDFLTNGDFHLSQHTYGNVEMSQLLDYFAVLGNSSQNPFSHEFGEEFINKFISLDQRSRAEYLIRGQIESIKRISNYVNNYYKNS